jgi:RimJ/RimL family protein N-acetyltransferase
MTRILATSRLLLRPPRAGDAYVVADLINNPRIAHNLARVRSPYSLDDAHNWLNGLHASADPVFAITLNGKLIGVIGIEGERHEGELGYWLSDPYWGMGYTREAATTIIEHAFATTGYEAIVAGYRHGNEASRRILIGLGFRHTGHAQVYSLGRKAKVLTARLEITRREWNSGRARKCDRAIPPFPRAS